MKNIQCVRKGSDIKVTNNKLPEYMECCIKYCMLGHVKPQLTELLLGFYNLLPEQLLTVFFCQVIVKTKYLETFAQTKQ